MTYTADKIPNSLNITDSQSTVVYLQNHKTYLVCCNNYFCINVNCCCFQTAHLSVMYVSIMQTVLSNTLLMLILVNILSIAINICGEMIDQAWEKPYLPMGIFIICDGAMNTYLKENYLIKIHDGKFRSK